MFSQAEAGGERCGLIQLVEWSYLGIGSTSSAQESTSRRSLSRQAMMDPFEIGDLVQVAFTRGGREANEIGKQSIFGKGNISAGCLVSIDAIGNRPALSSVQQHIIPSADSGYSLGLAP